MPRTPDEIIAYWRQPDRPWWAKLRRARLHVDNTKELLKEFLQTEPWSIESRSGFDSNNVAYVLRVHNEVPVHLKTSMGDAVHNMRSALDAVSYEFVVEHLGTSLTAEQERLTEFPIKPSLEEFEAWMRVSRKGTLRSDMYGELEQKALRCVQPFAIAEEGGFPEGDANDFRRAEWNTSALRRLHEASVIDKHRHLTVLGWFPDLLYWSTPPDGSSYTWRPAVSNRTQFVDETLLGHLVNTSGRSAPQVKVSCQMQLTISDEPFARTDLANTLDDWLRSISGWTVPRALITAAGFATPILIDGSWQV